MHFCQIWLAWIDLLFALATSAESTVAMERKEASYEQVRFGVCEAPPGRITLLTTLHRAFTTTR